MVVTDCKVDCKIKGHQVAVLQCNHRDSERAGIRILLLDHDT